MLTMSFMLSRICRGILSTASIACWLCACGSDSDSGPTGVTTAEMCKDDADCKMEPEGVCKEEHTVIHYDVPRCGSDQRCVWGGTESHCDYMCQDGYCITAR
ncbi:MAG TPA: hypothetical protein VK550_18330 [Polyangiaceae bacterium]|nr:hypothetical protein [Polyangiaceae bacterium]